MFNEKIESYRIFRDERFLITFAKNYRLMKLLKKLNFLISGYWKSVILYFIYNILTAFFFFYFP